MQKLNILSGFTCYFLLSEKKNHVCWINHSFTLAPPSPPCTDTEPVCCRSQLSLQSCFLTLALLQQSLCKTLAPLQISDAEKNRNPTKNPLGLRGLRGWTPRICLFPGAVNIPGAMVGIVVGGAILKRFQVSLKQCSAMCVLGMLLCLLVAFPLLFLGCPTQKVAGVTYGERY